ncbi:MAG: hypothetical protein IT383_02665 [Deltaproteobacteria bacterium]|nr:hypothetical protein [Deltaproteobacteria bacterium]
MIGALALALALAPPPADAWPELARAAAVVLPLSEPPLFSFVRGGPHPEPLLDEDLGASLEALRAAEGALAPLDAAIARGRCALPAGSSSSSLEGLGDWLLGLAVSDARAGKGKLAAVQLGRAADLAALVARCTNGGPATQATALAIAGRARMVLIALGDDALVPAEAVARLAAALRPTTELVLAAGADAALRGALDDARAEQALVEEAGAALVARQRTGGFPPRLPIEGGRLVHGERWFALEPVQRAPTEVRCSPGDAPGSFTMTREAAALLARRGPEAVLQGSLVTPQLDGSMGLLVARAGPVARSCGLVDGDVVLAVNEVQLAHPEDALVAAPAAVQRDGRARFVVRRGGAERSLVIEPERRELAGATR